MLFSFFFCRTDKARQAYAEAFENEDLETQVNYGYEVRGVRV
jgi:hypothetical protein